jgi:hypothetical protein
MRCHPAGVAHITLTKVKCSAVGTVVLHVVGDALAGERADEVVDVVLGVDDDLCVLDVVDGVCTVVAASVHVASGVGNPLLCEFKVAFGVHCWLLVVG